MKKVLSFILCCLPLILFLVGVIFFIITTVSVEVGLIYESVADGWMLLCCLIIFMAVIAVYGVMAWLMVKACKRKDFDSGKKVIWIVCLYMLNMFAYPVYWFKYIRKED